jgi:hypothetical protein
MFLCIVTYAYCIVLPTRYSKEKTKGITSTSDLSKMMITLCMHARAIILLCIPVY